MKGPIAFEGRELMADGGRLELEHPIVEAHRLGEAILVLFDHMAGPHFRQFQNLVAIDGQGMLRWTAEHPTNETNDGYLTVNSVEPLVATSFGCWRCTLDPATGRIVGKTWTK